MKDGAEVTVLRPMNPANISQQLRRTADEIERGELTCETMVAVLNTDDGVSVYGWGNVDGARAVALLSLGTHELHRLILRDARGGYGRAI